jgi:5-methylcytosine-specific restriction protein A
MLDQDGEQPDDGPPPGVNELFITRNRSGSGGRIKGRFDDAAMFDADRRAARREGHTAHR